VILKKTKTKQNKKKTAFNILLNEGNIEDEMRNHFQDATKFM
jgi:hypothetical protein